MVLADLEFPERKDQQIYLNFLSSNIMYGIMKLPPGDYNRRSIISCLEYLAVCINSLCFLETKADTASTRLHYNRMRTAHLLTVSPSMHCAGGCLLREGAWSGGSGRRGGSGLEGSAPGGPGWGGGGGWSGWEVVSQHALRQTPPPVNRMTDRCKNITFANFVCGW